MDGRAIAAAALGHAGLGMLTTDFGRTRLAETMAAPREACAAQAEGQHAARAGGFDAARATRP